MPFPSKPCPPLLSSLCLILSLDDSWDESNTQCHQSPTEDTLMEVKPMLDKIPVNDPLPELLLLTRAS